MSSSKSCFRSLGVIGEEDVVEEVEFEFEEVAEKFVKEKLVAFKDVELEGKLDD